jgi:hypothetical protein
MCPRACVRCPGSYPGARRIDGKVVDACDGQAAGNRERRDRGRGRADGPRRHHRVGIGRGVSDRHVAAPLDAREHARVASGCEAHGRAPLRRPSCAPGCARRLRRPTSRPRSPETRARSADRPRRAPSDRRSAATPARVQEAHDLSWPDLSAGATTAGLQCASETASTSWCRAAGWPRRGASGSDPAGPPGAARHRRSRGPTASGRRRTRSRRAPGAAP